ncbi:hypothetical protein ABW20_dc0102479 [Dactylellina cionopaga]|nr:hypothetical protein ABW20_dc0102479 [Dactylellina cionopaga]
MSSAEFTATAVVVSSIIVIIDGIHKVIEAALDAEGLPRIFRRASHKLPIISEILGSTKSTLEKNEATEIESFIKSTIDDCQGNWQKLKGLFEKVIPDDKTSSIERYYRAVKSLGKGGEVEILMKEMLECGHLLVTFKIMTAAKAEKIVKPNIDEKMLLKAIADVAGWESSVPDHIFEQGIHTATISGGGHIVAQGEIIKQSNLKDHARQIGITGDYYENVYYQVLSKNVAVEASKNAEPEKIKCINIVIPFRMPVPRNRTFIGRAEELGKIYKYFTESKYTVTPSIFALTGTGGIGKTQIALEYAYQYSNDYTAIFWVYAASEDTIRASFIDIMQCIVKEQARITWPESVADYEVIGSKLGIPGLIDGNGIVSTDLGMIGNIKLALFRWLQLPGNSKWLLIFDNADDLDTFDIQEYLPNQGGGAILITSTRPEFSQGAEQTNLDGLDCESAVALLLSLARLPDIPGGMADSYITYQTH